MTDEELQYLLLDAATRGFNYGRNFKANTKAEGAVAESISKIPGWVIDEWEQNKQPKETDK